MASISKSFGWRLAPGADPAPVNAPQMMPGTEGNAILARVVPAVRAESDMVIVELAPCRAHGDRAAPAVPGEDGVAMAWLALPFGLHVEQQLLEATEERIGGMREGEDGGPEERHDRHRRREDNLRVGPFPLGPRTHLPLRDSE